MTPMFWLVACLIPVEIPIYVPVETDDSQAPSTVDTVDMDRGSDPFAPTALRLALETGLANGAPIDAWASVTAEGAASPPTLSLELTDATHRCAWSGPISVAGSATLSGVSLWDTWSFSASADDSCGDAVIAGWDSVAAMLASGELALGVGPLSEAALASLGDESSGRESAGWFGVYLGIDGGEAVNLAYATALALDGDATLSSDESGDPVAALPGEDGFTGAIYLRAAPLPDVDLSALTP